MSNLLLSSMQDMMTKCGGAPMARVALQVRGLLSGGIVE